MCAADISAAHFLSARAEGIPQIYKNRLCRVLQSAEKYAIINVGIFFARKDGHIITFQKVMNFNEELRLQRH